MTSYENFKRALTSMLMANNPLFKTIETTQIMVRTFTTFFDLYLVTVINTDVSKHLDNCVF